MIVAAVAMLMCGVAAVPDLAVEVPADAVMGDGLGLTPPLNPVAATCADGEKTKGIDVSKWNGDIDWDKVAADGVEYAFVRVSDGLSHFDPRFAENWAEARAAGIHTGVYQFFRPNLSAKAQADLLIENMGELGPDDLPPVIDVEATGGVSKATMVAKIGEWIDRVEAATGVKPIIYSGRFFWQDNVGSDEWADHPFWIAHYTNNCPNIASQWDDWVFHQYTDSGSVSGISGKVDLNDFNGSVTDLLEYTATPPVCGDAICNGDENSDVCLADCEPCGFVKSDGSVIDNDDECFTLEGPEQYWRTASSGHGGELNWTKSTKTTVFNFATWAMHFDKQGDYTVEVFVDEDFGQTKLAHYELTHAGVEDVIVVDQSDASGWTELGSYGFDAGGKQSLRLTDKTGESGRRIAFDAIRVQPAGGVQAVQGDDDEGVDPSGERGDAGSCSVGTPSPAAGWMFLLMLGAFARRRRVA